MDRNQQIRDLFDSAVELSGNAREIFLRELTIDQETMGELLALIKAHDTEPTSLERPLVDLRSMFDPSSPDSALDDHLARAWIGRQIATYRLVRLIGRGGMGIVFEAQQERPKRMVALKMLRYGLRSGAQRRRFEHEAFTLGLLQHRYIAQVFEAGTAEIDNELRPYFAMELVDGVPLTQFVSENQLSIRQRLALFSKIGDAVHHAHLRSVIHRDLKPDNILVTSDGSPKVLDFGIARMTNADVQATTLHTNIGQVIGTLSYMSPEQASGNPDEVDLRSDVYALGIILYELLAGRRPHDLTGTMIHEAVRIIREDEPMSLGTIEKTCRGDLDAIVAKAMEKAPQRRYQSALDLAADVQHFLKSEPIVARPPSNTYRLGKFVRRHRMGVFAGGVVAFAILAAAGTSFAFAIREASQRRIAENATKRAQENLALAEQREKEASSARDQLESVVEFQSSMLSDIDAEAMGSNLFTSLRERTRKGLIGTGASQEDIDSALASFDKLNATDVALQIVDEEILARAVETIEKEFANQPLLEAALRQAIGYTYRELGLYPQSLPQLERALTLRRQGLGDDHPKTLESINDMGALLKSMGKRAEALPYFREALEGNRRVLGTDHPHTLNSIHYMGSLLHSMGNYAEALPYHTEVLSARRRVLGDTHKDTLTSINNTGSLLHSMGKYNEALPLLHEALEVRRRVLGDDHPDTLVSMTNMGSILSSTGKYAEALPYCREALAGNRRALGNEHPDTLHSINNMGGLLDSLGKPAQASPYYHEALETRRRVLGDEHPDTLTSINNMGSLLYSMQEYAKALPYLREALERQREVLGNRHPNTMASINNMGALLYSMGKSSEAVPYFREGLKGVRAALGNDHPNTLRSISNMGFLLESMEESAKALAYYREALESRRRVLGNDHPETLQSINSIGSLLFSRGKYAEALPYYQETLEAQRRALGNDHPDTLNSINNMGDLLIDLGRHREATAVLEAGEAAARQAWTDGDTRWLGNYLAKLGKARAGLGDYGKAESTLTEAHELLASGFGEQHRRTITCVNSLIDLYQVWSKPDKAAEWREKLPVGTANE